MFFKKLSKCQGGHTFENNPETSILCMNMKRVFSHEDLSGWKMTEMKEILKNAMPHVDEEVAESGRFPWLQGNVW